MNDLMPRQSAAGLMNIKKPSSQVTASTWTRPRGHIAQIPHPVNSRSTGATQLPVLPMIMQRLGLRASGIH